jgi:hypothetical protein
VADHGKEIGLGPVCSLCPLAQAPFGVDSLDKAFDLRIEIVGPEIFRLHGFPGPPFPFVQATIPETT